jgi:hypothetical protein
MNEFMTWQDLATNGGALAAVLLLTQLTKGIPGIDRIPTRIWSYVLSLVVLLSAGYFLGTLTMDSAGLSLINAAIVSLASNGGYDVIKRNPGGEAQ